MMAGVRTRVLRRADALARVGRVDDARDCLLELVETSPADWSVVQAAAELCARTGRSEDAVRLYLGMARHFASQGMAVRAEQLYEEVLRLAPGDRVATFRRAELAAAGGDRERARTLLASVVPEGEGSLGDGARGGLRLPATPADVLAGLTAGRFDDARQALVRLASRERGLAPQFTEAWLESAGRAPERVSSLAVALADVCLIAGDADAAIRTLKEFLARVPGDLVVLRHLIAVAVEAGAGAVALDAQTALVDTLIRLGRLAEALPIAEDLVARLPDAANRARAERLASAVAAGPDAAPSLALAVDTAKLPAASPGDTRVRDLSDALEALGAP